MKHLKNIRRALAVLMFVGISALFLDPTGTVQKFLGWTAHLQFFPSILAGFLILVVATLLLTFFFGRWYCSVICPLGIMQDFFAWIGRLGSKKRKFKYSFSTEKRVLRFGVLALFLLSFALTIFPILHFVAALLEPYSIFGRIMTTIFAPISRTIAVSLAESSAEAGDFVYSVPAVLNTNSIMLGVAIVSLVIVAVLSFMNGRTYCNTVCPVGTLLSLVSRFSLFRVKIDESKCRHCGLCARQCKASCIDTKSMKVDTSRCVGCMDCLDSCNSGAISYGKVEQKPKQAESVDNSKRTFLTVGAMFGSALLMETKAKELAKIKSKERIERGSYVSPPGSESHKHLEQICTACGLCLTACPNDVLKPSADLMNLLKPQLSFENGFCRPECNKCGSVCPTGAIKPVDVKSKDKIHIGYAVVSADLCLAAKGKPSCGNCARHCPAGAISMVKLAAEGRAALPKVDTQKCIGCGACEYLCPVRPVSAIHVEGLAEHKNISNF